MPGVGRRGGEAGVERGDERGDGASIAAADALIALVPVDLGEPRRSLSTVALEILICAQRGYRGISN
jgi:hypothetical protein